ncbi:MAG TPA: hypothetical protein PLB10_18565 [Thiolinea sp.]|nr:hypothetical protein [Thiolinea sp.]
MINGSSLQAGLQGFRRSPGQAVWRHTGYSDVNQAPAARLEKQVFI